MWRPHVYLFALSIAWCDIIIHQASAQQQSYYHYPAPNQHQQFHETGLGTAKNYDPSPNYYRAQHQSAYQAQEQMQRYALPQPMYYAIRATGPTTASIAAPPPTIVKQFSSPMLESAAFTMALTRQGYVAFGNNNKNHHHSLNDAAPSQASLTRNAAQQLASPATVAKTENAGRALMTMMLMTMSHSQNVKLPLPLGITPLAFNPLPLQAGAPYSTVRGLTSYGTTYPQRRRRRSTSELRTIETSANP